MKAGHAFPQQLFGLPRRVVDPEPRDRLVVGAQAVELLHQRLRKIGAAQRDEPFDLRRARDGNDSGDERHGEGGRYDGECDQREL